MNTTPIPPHKATTKSLAAARYKRAYDRLLSETPEIRNPHSDYWRKAFEIAAGQLVRLIGVERYRRWFDLRFPANILYTWKAAFDAVTACLQRLQAEAHDLLDQAVEDELRALDPEFGGKGGPDAR